MVVRFTSGRKSKVRFPRWISVTKVELSPSLTQCLFFSTISYRERNLLLWYQEVISELVSTPVHCYGPRSANTSLKLKNLPLVICSCCTRSHYQLKRIFNNDSYIALVCFNQQHIKISHRNFFDLLWSLAISS